MRGKLLLVIGVAVGYVLGARAGRERFEQIKDAANKAWNKPAVQSGVDKVAEFAKERGGMLGGKVVDSVKGFVDRSVAPDDTAKRDASTVRQANKEPVSES